MKISIKAIEYYLPPKTEDGATLKRENPDWRIEDIEKKTGVRVRHIADTGQTAVDMAELAAGKLFAAGIMKENIDFVVLVTQSPDYVLPTSACILQDRLRLPLSCMAFDINLGCSGFIYGLAIGGSLIETGLAKRGLICCSETYTKYIAKTDRVCRPLFSDGAAVTLLEACDRHDLGPFEMGTDGSGFHNLIVPLSDARPGSPGTDKNRLFMAGAEVFMFTMDKVPECITALLKKSKKTIGDIDCFIFHQASKLVIDNIIRRLELPEEKVFRNYQMTGNTVSASIPIALKDAALEKKIKKDNLVMLVGFGTGYSWGSCLVKWSGEL